MTSRPGSSSSRSRSPPVADEATGKGNAVRAAYARAGVDVAAGDLAVERMRAAVGSTRRPEVVGGLGGFGGAISIPAGYREPLIVSSTDGVGTKTALATALGRWDTIGIDLVAMCADDVVCSGAEPLAFLDYVAVGRVDPDAVASLVAGVAAGCVQAGCALVGGETAEHPGLMEPGTFDLAGTCVGIVERDDLLDGTRARAGDLVLGLPSSGLHANGYSLVRALLAEWEIPLERPYQEQVARTLGDAGRDEMVAAEPAHELATVGDVLLEPTRIYARALLAARGALRAAGHDIRGMAHVTGGGLPGNAPRAIPAGLGVRLDPSRWRMPSVMRLLGALGGIDDVELRATFNGGIGMVVVVAPEAVAAARAALPEALEVGRVAPVAELGSRYVEGRLEGGPGGRP
ncbi:MAG: phosphoribosylformylglycinamidine cyclo-ligase [Chloroflexi bacterium]|nr:phosphoribosylformylglycinamidine cyclo-ligase [Chloroflexota bacterium]